MVSVVNREGFYRSGGDAWRAREGGATVSPDPETGQWALWIDGPQRRLYDIYPTAEEARLAWRDLQARGDS